MRGGCPRERERLAITRELSTLALDYSSTSKNLRQAAYEHGRALLPPRGSDKSAMASASSPRLRGWRNMVEPLANNCQRTRASNYLLSPLAACAAFRAREGGVGGITVGDLIEIVCGSTKTHHGPRFTGVCVKNWGGATVSSKSRCQTAPSQRQSADLSKKECCYYYYYYYY